MFLQLFVGHQNYIFLYEKTLWVSLYTMWGSCAFVVITFSKPYLSNIYMHVSSKL